MQKEPGSFIKSWWSAERVLNLNLAIHEGLVSPLICLHVSLVLMKATGQSSLCSHKREAVGTAQDFLPMCVY